jgi:hypothetical protein
MAVQHCTKPRAVSSRHRHREPRWLHLPLHAWIAAIAQRRRCGLRRQGADDGERHGNGLATGTAVTVQLNGKETLVLAPNGGFEFTTS